MKWSFVRQRQSSNPAKDEMLTAAITAAQAIVSTFGERIASTGTDGALRDVSTLPHSKERIFSSICVLWDLADADTRDALRGVACCLAHFQIGVGPQPLHPLGFDAGRLDVAALSPDHVTALMVANVQGKSRYERMKTFVDADWARMSAALDALDR